MSREARLRLKVLAWGLAFSSAGTLGLMSVFGQEVITRIVVVAGSLVGMIAGAIMLAAVILDVTRIDKSVILTFYALALLYLGAWGSEWYRRRTERQIAAREDRLRRISEWGQR